MFCYFRGTNLYQTSQCASPVIERPHVELETLVDTVAEKIEYAIIKDKEEQYKQRTHLFTPHLTTQEKYCHHEDERHCIGQPNGFEPLAERAFYHHSLPHLHRLITHAGFHYLFLAFAALA